MIKFNKTISWLGLSTIAATIGINIIGYLGAYVLTNYRSQADFSWGYPRPENKQNPADFNLPYKSDAF